MSKLAYTIIVILFGVVGVAIVLGVGYLLYWQKPVTTDSERSQENAATATYSCTDDSMIVAIFERDEAHLSFSNGRTATVGWTAPAIVEGEEGIRFATADGALIFWRTKGFALIEEAGVFTHGKCALVEP